MLVWDKHQQLSTNPLSVEIGGENLPLRPLARHEKPRLSTSFTKLVHLAETDEDWANVVDVLKAYNNRGSLTSRIQDQFIRKACLAGRIDIVLQCLNASKETNFNLGNEQILRRVLWDTVHREGAKAGWSGEASALSLKRARQIADLMMHEEHVSGDLASQSWVVGFLLEAAAMNAKANHGGADSDGLVQVYTRRMLSATKGTPIEVGLIQTSP